MILKLIWNKLVNHHFCEIDGIFEFLRIFFIIRSDVFRKLEYFYQIKLYWNCRIASKLWSYQTLKKTLSIHWERFPLILNSVNLKILHKFRVFKFMKLFFWLSNLNCKSKFSKNKLFQWHSEQNSIPVNKFLTQLFCFRNQKVNN